MKIGFIGLGNVGSKLAGSILRNGFELSVLDLDQERVDDFVKNGANRCKNPREIAQTSDMIITCLPSPDACAAVMESTEGVIAGLTEGKIWAEMSTTDATEVRRMGGLVKERGAEPIDCPVSGGCHRAATGNISIFVGCERKTFDRALPIIKVMGRRILHTGGIGTASILKVITNFLATANLVTLCEALTTAKAADIDLNTTYEAIRISSGNSFVHETESQVILNGSRDINFTMDLVLKDISLFQEVADRQKVPLEVSPILRDIFMDGIEKYGPREFSPNIIKRLEELTGLEIRASGFPAEILDDEPEVEGFEVNPQDRDSK